MKDFFNTRFTLAKDDGIPVPTLHQVMYQFLRMDGYSADKATEYVAEWMKELEEVEYNQEHHPVKAHIWKRRNEWVLELSGSLDGMWFVSRHIEPLSTPLHDVAGLPSLYAALEEQVKPT